MPALGLPEGDMVAHKKTLPSLTGLSIHTITKRLGCGSLRLGDFFFHFEGAV